MVFFVKTYWNPVFYLFPISVAPNDQSKKLLVIFVAVTQVELLTLTELLQDILVFEIVLTNLGDMSSERVIELIVSSAWVVRHFWPSLTLSIYSRDPGVNNLDFRNQFCNTWHLTN